jgi:hypothetical protein
MTGLRERLARQPPPNDAAASGDAETAELVDRLRAALAMSASMTMGSHPAARGLSADPHAARHPRRPHTRISADHATALAAALDQAPRAADAETERFRAGLDAPKAATIRDVANHIARSADAAQTHRVRGSTATLS